MLARDCLNLTQIGKITRGANHAQWFVVFIEHWLNRNEQRPVETVWSDFNRNAATCFECFLDDAGFVFFAGPENVATVACPSSNFG